MFVQRCVMRQAFRPNSYRWLVSRFSGHGERLTPFFDCDELCVRRRFKEALELARRTCGSSQDVRPALAPSGGVVALEPCNPACLLRCRLEIAMCYKEFRRERKLGSRHATSNAAAESAPAACRSLSFVTWQGNGQAKLG